jgi:hypothetical protein
MGGCPGDGGFGVDEAAATQAAAMRMHDAIVTDLRMGGPCVTW